MSARRPSRKSRASAAQPCAITAGRALLIVNDRADVAALCGADGVHLGERGLPVAAVHGWLPAGMLAGRSVHDVEGARPA